MQVVSIAEYAILNVTKIDKYLGEQILALDAINMTEGFILHSYEVDKTELKKLIKNTAASNYKFVDPVSESRSRARVGLAAKGVDADDISRGDVLCSPNLSNINLVTDSIAAGFTKSPYYKGNLTENQTYIISVGTQIKPVKVKNINNNTIEIIPEKPIVYFSSQPYALIKPDNIGTRIIGKGTMQ